MDYVKSRKSDIHVKGYNGCLRMDIMNKYYKDTEDGCPGLQRCLYRDIGDGYTGIQNIVVQR